MDQDIDDVLNARWLEMRDDAGVGGVRFSLGLLTGLLAAGAITEIERDGWAARFNSCPGHQGGSRVWCGFCGDLCSVCDCLRHECSCPKDIDEEATDDVPWTKSDDHLPASIFDWCEVRSIGDDEAAACKRYNDTEWIAENGNTFSVAGTEWRPAR